MGIVGMRALHDAPSEWPAGSCLRQRFDGPVATPERLLEGLRQQLEASQAFDALPDGARIGVAVGSRGLTNLAAVVRTTVDVLRRRGFEVVILPAMGSHGAATADGQRAVLAEYGVDEASMGVPIEADMRTEIIDHDAKGRPVHFSSVALHSVQAVVPINRIKLHTDFRGPVESGLCKMLVIGLGKQQGAETTHALGMAAFREAIPERASIIQNHVRVPVGVAIVEDAMKSTMTLEVVDGDHLVERETRLLEEAARVMARLPFEAADLLILERMGKDISGPGCDPNVFGRYLTPGMSGGPTIDRIGCLDLTVLTRGNAVGIGQIDVITERLFDQIDFTATYTNLITSGGLEYAMVPMVAASDRDLVLIGLAGAYVPIERARIAIVRSTSHLEHLWVSQTLFEEMDHSRVEVIGEEPLTFGPQGDLLTRPSGWSAATTTAPDDRDADRRGAQRP